MSYGEILFSAPLDKLGITGQSQKLCLQWTGGITKAIPDSEVLDLKISGQGTGKPHLMKNVYTVEKLDLPKQTLRFEVMEEQFSHLRGLPVKSFNDATPRILIGLDNTSLLTSLKIREGQSGDPVATKTRLGWTVYGAVSKAVPTHNVQQTFHICAQTTEDDLHELVRQYFSIDSIGVSVAPSVERADDLRARKILDETTIRTASGKLETGLLWNHDYVEFPDSRMAAEKRLLCLERRLAKDEELYSKVRQLIAEYVTKGYSHKVSDIEFSQFDPRRIWYLPINIVLNPRKPSKVRIVWDAAAKVHGVSLNSKLLKGPDLLVALTSVLFQFRQRQIAVIADLKEMFHQLLMRWIDRQSQLFVWRNDLTMPIETYMMDVATFGASCSPCSAHYVKNKNALEYEETYPDAANAVLNNHYVDDYLDSMDTEEEAVRLALQVKELHSKAGFVLRNWMSNSEEVLRWVGDSSPGSVKSFTIANENGSERVLGMIWIPSADEFCYAVDFCVEIKELLTNGAVPTKRQRTIMSIFDPLGLVSNVTIHGKAILQDVWRSKVDWDDPIPNELVDRWQQWVAAVRDLRSVKVPRCYFPGYDPSAYDSLQLHIFVDASSQAYSAVAYFRIVDRGVVRCSLVASKAKVAPLQIVSIPRLELQAAVIGVRLAKSIVEQHSVSVNQRYFWSDSSTVISWIQSDQRRYRQFVAFRVNEILGDSKEEEWRWISTKTNVSDEATKWKKKPELNQDSRWFRGPEFLYETQTTWMQPTSIDIATTEELRPAYVNYHAPNEALIDVTRFSRWERLHRTLAYVHKFTQLTEMNSNEMETTAGEVELTRDLLQMAERTAWKVAQSDTFLDEIITLKRSQESSSNHQPQLEKCSKLYKLSPFLDEHGVLRVESRLSAANFASYDARNPIILPRGHSVTNLILDWYHREYNHGNGELIVNEVRQKFHIVHLRVEVRKAAKRCQWCRVYKAVPSAPRMAALPAERLSPFVKPFTYTGIDYFGPYLIKINRSNVKRWVALFTCLSVRAVHLEVVGSLTTDSCKKAIRRFVARRGAPQDIFSDRGTNFIGASKELQNEIADLETDLASTFTDTTTQWHFNPPSSPHMGGCWERMVRAVKKALGSLESAASLDEESFATMLADAESMVNSRPLTYIPLESQEQESLTLNHFLLMSSSGVKQPVKNVTPSGITLRNSWNQVQQILDLFWNRWVKEYLPTISRRTKWFSDTRSLTAGDLVVVVDENVRNKWVRGRVLRVFPGKDGRIRRAEVQTANGILQRPAVKLALLDVVEQGIAEDESPTTRVGECYDIGSSIDRNISTCPVGGVEHNNDSTGAVGQPVVTAAMTDRNGSRPTTTTAGMTASNNRRSERQKRSEKRAN